MDREQVVELLKVAFVQDRLTQDELDTGAGLALASRTYAELTALTADIPAERATVELPPPSQPPPSVRLGPSAHQPACLG